MKIAYYEIETRFLRIGDLWLAVQVERVVGEQQIHVQTSASDAPSRFPPKVQSRPLQKICIWAIEKYPKKFAYELNFDTLKIL